MGVIFSRQPTTGGYRWHMQRQAANQEQEMADFQQALPPNRLGQSVYAQQPQIAQPQQDFSARFHRYNVAGNFFTALSAAGCGLGSFARIGAACGTENYVAGRCVGAGFGMAGVITGLAGAVSGVCLAFSSLYNGEGGLWRYFNLGTSFINLTAAMAAGGPAMYAYFNTNNPEGCHIANLAAFGGFWISVASAAAFVVEDVVPHGNHGIFRIANAANTSLAAIASILAASPDLCMTTKSVQHGGGGQAFVAILNCLGVVCGVVGGACSTIGAFG